MEADQVPTGGDEQGEAKIDSFPSQVRVERVVVAGNASDDQDDGDQEIAVVVHVEQRDDTPSE